MKSKLTPAVRSYCVTLICLMVFITGANGDCVKPPRFDYAVLTTASQYDDTFTTGQSVQYSCVPGYIKISNDNVRVCQADSTWSTPSTPFCQLRKCSSPPDILHGTSEYEDVTFGSIVTYKCDEGYRFINKNTRECQADGTWSGELPICEVQICPPPNAITDGDYDPKKDEYEYLNAVTYKCNKDLTLVGAGSIFCTAFGNWSNVEPQCKVVSCADPNVPNSERTSGFNGPYTLNSAITFKCKSGFVMVGSDSVRCNVQSQWEPQLPLCSLECPTPNVQNAKKLTGLTGPYTLNSSVTFECNKGFIMTGSSSVICNDKGQWDPQLPTCQIECPTPNVENAKKLTGLTGPYIFKSTVTFECNKAFIMTGSSSVTCNDKGQWEPQLPTCQKIECPTPNVQNAEKLTGLTGPYTLNSSVTFECNKGFIMTGSSFVTCNDKGQWDPQLPTCHSKCSHPVVQNANIVPGSTVSGPHIWNSSVTFQCTGDFTMSGSATVKCDVNGAWQPALPVCEESSSVGAIVGGIVGAIVIIGILGAGIYCYCRKKGFVSPSNSNYNDTSSNNQTHVDQASKNSIHYKNQTQEIDGC
ncbi:Hypothetical predicted protein [Pelobates cultripes]|uniref:Sushi domain-containing protein n=1 Tax=Pelobates cultripes TaxID=61616 RepID=A0AAD1R249_PELCU|nr:Hypothetical predicted protein [Pelobates cultripes]